MFLGPNSQALLPPNTSPGVDNGGHLGYRCQSGFQYRQISIHHYADEQYGSVCSVSHQAGNGAERVLWKNQRNSLHCENKAAALALRLEDRGWACGVRDL